MISNILGKMVGIFLLYSYLNATANFNISLSNNDIYTTQGIKVTLVLKYDQNTPIIKTDFEELSAENFWIKPLDESKIIKKDNLFYKKFTYLVFAQNSGTLVIKPQVINIATRQAKTNQIIWSKLYTKSVYIKSKPLPDNLFIQGNYTIKSYIDKTSIKANQPINLTLKIKGKGNIDDIKPFELNLNEQLVFSSKPEIKTDYSNNIYKGEFTQKFSIVANKDFTIPSFSFKYFNIDTNLVEIIKTKPIKITVLNPTNTQENYYTKYLYTLFGFLFAFLTIFIYRYLKKLSSKRSLNIYKQIKNAKDDKQLYNTLLTYYNKNGKLKQVILKLEQNIYFDADNKINKKDILKLL